MELSDWADTERLVGWVHDATETLIGAVDDFADDDDRWYRPYLPVVNPPIWELAHVAWFAEWFVLRQMHGRDSLIDASDARYDSAKVAHRTRWELQFPTATATKDYARRVADGLVEVLKNDGGIDSTNFYVAYAIAHHDAHCEALSYSRQTLAWGDRPTPNLTHVPWWEAQAWFPWGDRDPSLNEAALDGVTGGTVPVGAFSAGDGPWGHRQLIGNVWKWTSSTFEPYPLFEPDAYRDNSEPWFGTRKVLRGGSWSTRNRYVRSTYRNYFTPDRRDVFAGFRTCAR